MKTDNNNLDKLRKAWSETGEALPSDGNKHESQNLNKQKTALDNLRDRYRSFWIMGLCLAFGTFMIFWNKEELIGSNTKPLAISYSIYSLICFCFDFWLWRGVRTINPVTMDVSEVASRALFYHKRHLQFMCILLPLAVLLVGFTAYVFQSETYMVWGIVVGVIIGAILGIMQFRRFMASYRQLSD